MLSKTERIARGLLRHYLPNHKVVYNARPEWIINPETKQALEIDIMYPDLKLCVEVQGRQHLRWEPGLHKTYQEFEAQQRRDTLKMQAILDAGYTFCPLSIMELTQDSFEPFIKRFMKSHGLLPQFEHITPPRLLYTQAKSLSHAKVKSANYQPYRKPGLWPLLQRAWKRHQRRMKGQSDHVYE